MDHVATTLKSDGSEQHLFQNRYRFALHFVIALASS